MPLQTRSGVAPTESGHCEGSRDDGKLAVVRRRHGLHVGARDTGGRGVPDMGTLRLAPLRDAVRLAAVSLWLTVALLAYPVALWLPVLFPALFAALWVSAEVLTEARCNN
jgi:hypothetical protein